MLLEACDKGDLSSVLSLISTENLEQKNPQGFTALIIAAKQGHTNIIDLLIQSGANINASNHARQTPLFVACWNNQLESVNKLIEHKANLNQSDHRGWTPLIISVYQNNEDIAASLLEAGCDIEKKDCFGKQAIDRAKTIKMIDMIKAALAKQRKSSRLKSPARSVRSLTPSSTPKGVNVEIQRKRSTGSMGNRNSIEIRPLTPNATNRSSPLYRASSERSLSIDFRKQLREKVDKKTREKISNIESGLYAKWNSILNNCIQKTVREFDLDQRKSWKNSLDNKGKEVYSKLKEFTFKSFEVIRQSKLPKSQKSAQGVVAGGVDELVSESISKFQYLYTDQLEKNIEGQVEKQVRKMAVAARQEIFDLVQRSFNQAFFDRVQSEEFEEISDRKWENSEKMNKSLESKGRKTVGGEADKWNKGNDESFKGVVPKLKQKGGSGKGTPQMNIASTLQEFLKFEQMSKS